MQTKKKTSGKKTVVSVSKAGVTVGKPKAAPQKSGVKVSVAVGKKTGAAVKKVAKATGVASGRKPAGKSSATQSRKAAPKPRSRVREDVVEVNGQSPQEMAEAALDKGTDMVNKAIDTSAGLLTQVIGKVMGATGMGGKMK
jgi:hypothetical protein